MEINTKTLINNLKGTNVALYGQVSKQQEYYSISYKVFLKYFKDAKKLEIDKVIIAVGMVYSWMPRIPVKVEITKEIVELLNRAYNEELNKSEIDKIKNGVNNSLIATSKLLHFINPDIYPIWDSKIAAVFNIKGNKDINNVDNYIQYLEAIKGIDKVHLKNYDDKYAKTRNVDMALFTKMAKVVKK